MTVGSILSLSWLTGPILAKELRQASRRPWLMIIKTAYVALLVILIFIACGEPSHSEDLWQQMSYYSQALTRVIVWFQFIALQLIAVAAMSTSISDEVRRRTLVTLLSTPITPLQIVMGKLLSRLTAIAMLIGVSLPVLAIMRVFGGVPWDFLVQGLCITATAVLLAAAVSLFFSILCKRAYAVILLTLGSFLLLYFILPFVAAWMIHDSRWTKNASDDYIFAWLMFIINPYASLTGITMESLLGRGIMGSFKAPWIEHCLTMLGLSILVLWRCVAMVRKKSMREGEGFIRSRAAAPPPYQPPPKPAQQPISSHSSEVFSPDWAYQWAQKAEATAREIRQAQDALASAPRPVRGNPITWKEVASPLFASRAARWIVLGLAGLVILTIYYIAGSQEELHDRKFNVVMVSIYVFLGLLTAGAVAAGSVSGEKEGSTLELLLTTQISPWSIAWGKFAGSFRRSLIVWLPPAAHIPIMALSSWYDARILLMAPLIFAGLIVMIGGMGVYFSTAFRKTATAVMFLIGAMLLVWLFLPLIILWSAGFRSYGHDNIVTQLFFDSNPAVQVWAAVDGSYQNYDDWSARRQPDGDQDRRRYDWFAGPLDGIGSFFYILFFASVNVLIGMLSLLLSAMRLGRRRF